MCKVFGAHSCKDLRAINLAMTLKYYKNND